MKISNHPAKFDYRHSGRGDMFVVCPVTLQDHAK